PANVMAGLEASPVTDVHVFGRRGPEHVKFSPLELRELGQVPDVDIIVYPEDYVFDEEDPSAEKHHQNTQVLKTLVDWTLREPTGAKRRIHLHFLQAPHEILGEDGKVVGVRMERMELIGGGRVRGTGQYLDYPVQAVYRAIGYWGSPIDGVPFDEDHGVIANEGGRVIGEDGKPIHGLYTTGWIKRGPVGLIGHTKSDATETIAHLVEDVDELYAKTQATPEQLSPDNVMRLLKERGVDVIQWHDWEVLDAHERALGEADGRERIKVVPREEMVDISLTRAGSRVRRGRRILGNGAPAPPVRPVRTVRDGDEEGGRERQAVLQRVQDPWTLRPAVGRPPGPRGRGLGRPVPVAVRARRARDQRLRVLELGHPG